MPIKSHLKLFMVNTETSGTSNEILIKTLKAKHAFATQQLASLI